MMVNDDGECGTIDPNLDKYVGCKLHCIYKEMRQYVHIHSNLQYEELCELGVQNLSIGCDDTANLHRSIFPYYYIILDILLY